MKNHLNYCEFLERSKVNGPGERSVLWLQGCSIRCEGCFNRKMWPFINNKLLSVDQMAEKILAVEGVEGVTFTGGEPFDQAEALVKLAYKLKKASLNIVTFTGYEVEEIKKRGHTFWNKLFACSDLIIAGPYQSYNSSKSVVSSKNQRLIFNNQELMENPYFKDKNLKIEYIVHKNGEFIITGIP